MDIYRFINSKDIRNYLKKINYEFTPVEAAWLIWKCLDITREGKHKAWQEIIDTMPDCPIEVYEGNDVDRYDSLHEVLKECMITYNSHEQRTIPFYICNFKIDFPVPFKVGDIVCLKNDTGSDEIFVYGGKGNSKLNKHNSTIGYMVDGGRITHCYLYENVMNLESFNKDLSSEKTILYALSDYLKGKMRLDHLLNSYLLDVFEELTLQLRERQKSYFLFRNEAEQDDEDLPF